MAIQRPNKSILDLSKSHLSKLGETLQRSGKNSKKTQETGTSKAVSSELGRLFGEDIQQRAMEARISDNPWPPPDDLINEVMDKWWLHGFESPWHAANIFVNVYGLQARHLGDRFLSRSRKHRPDAPIPYERWRPAPFREDV